MHELARTNTAEYLRDGRLHVVEDERLAAGVEVLDQLSDALRTKTAKVTRPEA